MECNNLARIINHHILSGHNHQFWMRIPLVAPVDQIDDEMVFSNKGDMSEEKMERDTWKWWNKLRTLCDSQKKIGISLELSEDLPSSEVVARWCGEPVKSVIIPTSIFMTNKRGFPVLSRAHQVFIKRMFSLEAQMVISGSNKHTDKPIKCYQQYLDHVWQQQDPPDMAGQFSKVFNSTKPHVILILGVCKIENL